MPAPSYLSARPAADSRRPLARRIRQRVQRMRIATLYSLVANCLYDEMGNYLNPGQLNADHGGLAALTERILTDGPWCGTGSNAFDVDLLRVRKLRISLRMQVGDPQFRGTDPAFFWNPGKSEGGAKLIPDYSVAFDVTPRNLNLTR